MQAGIPPYQNVKLSSNELSLDLGCGWYLRKALTFCLCALFRMFKVFVSAVKARLNQLTHPNIRYYNTMKTQDGNTFPPLAVVWTRLEVYISPYKAFIHFCVFTGQLNDTSQTRTPVFLL